MSKIIIMNQGTEHTPGYDETIREPLAKSIWRTAWFAEPGDAIVSPSAIAEGFLAYIAELLEFEHGKVSVFLREKLRTEELVLSEQEVAALGMNASDTTTWTIKPCFWTNGIARFAARTGTGGQGGLEFAAQRGCDLLNRKSHFRQLASGAGISIAPGSVADSSDSLARGIRDHLSLTGTVIVKHDNSAGGAGNIAVTVNEVGPLPGCRETRKAEDIDALAERLWEELVDARGHAVVVESYFAAQHMFYSEYHLADGEPPRFLNAGDVRVEPDPKAGGLRWVGLDIPAELPPYSAANALVMSSQFAMRAWEIGYRGPINIDGIITTAGELVINEANARWGGGSVLHFLGEQLLGPRYADSHALTYVRDIPSPARPKAVDALKKAELHFTRESREGVVILACEEEAPCTMECLILASSRARAREIEAASMECLAREL